MTTTLSPGQAVRCPLTGRAVFTAECEKCEHVVEVRSPWRYWAVKCAVDGESTAAYP